MAYELILRKYIIQGLLSWFTQCMAVRGVPLHPDEQVQQSNLT